MTVYKIIFSLGCGFLVVVSSLLCVEYKFFKQETAQLIKVKSDYLHYVTVLKKQSLDTLSHRDMQEAEPQFLTVNREPAYLKKSALSFARQHNLERALRKFYQEDCVVSVESASMGSCVSTAKVAARKRIVRSGSKTPTRIDSLRKLQREPLFLWPLEKSEFWLSSPFGKRRKVDGSWGFHTGIDLAAPRGTPVKAAGPGIVVQAHYTAGYGNTIVIAHNHKFRTRYAHLDKMSVRVGQHIVQGEPIGKVGATGFVRKRRGGDGSHLHFEVYVYNKQVNPFYFLV
ncbi:M23 family metallopeptidase [Candidatus Dependentiae bacterium]|nr:M23 family metallopeptidase [Candidatus Dependentiae bacterium]